MPYPRSLCWYTTCCKVNTASKLKRCLKDWSSDILKWQNIYHFPWLKFGDFYRADLDLAIFTGPILILHESSEPPRDKTNKMTVRPAKTQITLGIRPVWSESPLCTHWVAKDPSFLHGDSEDSDQTGWMPRLIWVFTVRRCHFVGFVMGPPKSFDERFTLKLKKIHNRCINLDYLPWIY